MAIILLLSSCTGKFYSSKRRYHILWLRAASIICWVHTIITISWRIYLDWFISDTTCFHLEKAQTYIHKISGGEAFGIPPFDKLLTLLWWVIKPFNFFIRVYYVRILGERSWHLKPWIFNINILYFLEIQPDDLMKMDWFLICAYEKKYQKLIHWYFPLYLLYELLSTIFDIQRWSQLHYSNTVQCH